MKLPDITAISFIGWMKKIVFFQLLDILIKFYLFEIIHRKINKTIYHKFALKEYFQKMKKVKF